MKELGKTVYLLSLRLRDKDAYTGRFKEKLDISNRFKLASQVNAAILTSQSLEKGY